MFKIPETLTLEQCTNLVNIQAGQEDDYTQMSKDGGTFPVQITYDRFMYLLEVLPPCKWIHTMHEETFYVMEALTHSDNGALYTWVVRIDKKYYALAAEASFTHNAIVQYVRDCVNAVYKQSAPTEIWDKYRIYAVNAEDLGWNVKGFEEWLNT